MALGTPAYMAPEQAVADPEVDHRADLYAVAVVAYEMLTGTPPFVGTQPQVLKAHITEAPAPLKQRRSDVPGAVADVLMQALEKEPTHRPQSASEMIAVLDAVTTPPASAPRGPALARRSRRVWIASVAVVGLVAAGAAWAVSRPSVIASAQSLAIAPFAVADGDTALVRLGQNLVTTLSANLDGVGEIRVADPMSVLSHAKSKGALLSVQSALDIARRLGARSAVHGTLARSGSLVRADLALYDVAAPGTPVVRVSASVPGDSIAALTDSLTWSFLREVWARGRAPTPNAMSVHTRSPVALREFLEGERLFARGRAFEAVGAYVRAIQADTTFWFAHYRYKVVMEWYSLPVDTTIQDRLTRHFGELPERERLLIYAMDSTQTVSARQRVVADLLKRYPDYPPALLTYGDNILHRGRAGYDVGDAIPYFVRLADLMPADMLIAGHLGVACVAAADRDCAMRAVKRLDSLVRSDSAPPRSEPRGLLRLLNVAVHERGPAWSDSMVRVVQADSGLGTPLFVIIGAMLAEQPDLLVDHDRLLEQLSRRMPDFWRLRVTRAGSAVGRGDPTSIDSLRALATILPEPFRTNQRVDWALSRLQIAYEWQRLREPVSVTATEAIALVSRPDATPVERVESRWVAGASAIWRGDSALLRSQLNALAGDTTSAARIAGRSLRALVAGRSGDRAAAAESLLTIEREHGDRQKNLVWAALAVDRIVGADWLIESRRFLPADTLLRYTRGWDGSGFEGGVGQAMFAEAQLLRSRIAEGLGKKQEAIAFARIFLASFDRAPPSAKAQLDEARLRINRLGGGLDEPRAVRP
jgi:hypothetical protein